MTKLINQETKHITKKSVDVERTLSLPDIILYGDYKISKKEMEKVIKDYFINTCELEYPVFHLNQFEIPEEQWESWNPRTIYEEKRLYGIDNGRSFFNEETDQFYNSPDNRFGTLLEDGYGYMEDWDDTKIDDNHRYRYIIKNKTDLLNHLHYSLKYIEKGTTREILECYYEYWENFMKESSKVVDKIDEENDEKFYLNYGQGPETDKEVK